MGGWWRCLPSRHPEVLGDHPGVLPPEPMLTGVEGRAATLDREQDGVETTGAPWAWLQPGFAAAAPAETGGGAGWWPVLLPYATWHAIF